MSCAAAATPPWADPRHSGTSYISSSTGYTATINYAGKGYFSGKAHSFKAGIAPSAQPTHPLYSIEGEWAGVSKYKGKAPGKDTTFWDASSERREVQVKPLAEQGDMESRKVWAKTAEGIRAGNFDAASKDKTRIEVSAAGGDSRVTPALRPCAERAAAEAQGRDGGRHAAPARDVRAHPRGSGV